MIFKEASRLAVSNPVLDDFTKPVTEALLADLKISEVRAIYPLIRSINSGRLTKNYTFYPAESLIGKNKVDDPTGYASFVKPYGKPILREHQAQNVQGMFGNLEEAEIPMGRIVYSGFRRFQEKKDPARTLPSKKYVPGTVEGDGSMFVVPAITDPEAITRVLGGAYHTVSIGSRVENVTEAISNQNIAQLRRDGKELPPYERGQLYEGRLSYWKMGEVRGVEVSFVNVPSDEYAGVTDPDIGVEGIRLLVGEKKPGTKEFNFFDAKSGEKVEWGMDEYSFDESHFVDSSKVGYDIWWLNSKKEAAKETELTAVTESKEGEESMNLEDILKEGLDSIITKYPEVSKENEAFKTLILESFKYEGDLDVAKIVSGEAADSIENVDLFKKVSDFALEVCGDWDENAAKLALSLYLGNEGTLKTAPLVVDETVKMTVGQLYGITEGDLKDLETTLTIKEFNELPDSVFAGDNKTIPVTNLESALYALQIVSEKELRGQIAINGQEFGLVLVDDKPVICPILIGTKETITVQPISIEKLEEVAPLLENVNTICESYNLTDEQSEAVNKFLEQISEDTFKKVEGAPLFAFTEQSSKPVVLGTAFLLDYFINHESSDKENTLVKLVGLVRKLDIKKETIDEAENAYNVFGTAVLKKFLSNVPSESKETTSTEEAKSTTETNLETQSVTTIPDPAAATVQTTDGNTKESKKKLPWYNGLQARPKQSGKTPVNKEKR